MTTEQKLELLEDRIKELELRLTILMKEYARHVAAQGHGQNEWEILDYLDTLVENARKA